MQRQYYNPATGTTEGLGPRAPNPEVVNNQVIDKSAVTPGTIVPPANYLPGPNGTLVPLPGGPTDPAVIARNAGQTKSAELAAENTTANPDDPNARAHITAVLAGNETMAQVPATLRNSVVAGLSQAPQAAYSPLAASRFTNAANRITTNYTNLPGYSLTANGLPYLQRIDAAMKTPGSVSDQDLLDSLTKLNTAGNAITDAQVKLITEGRSYADWVGTIANKFKNGGVLSDNQRNQIQSIAKAIYANYQKGYQPIYNQVKKQYDEAGIPDAFRTLPDLNNLSAQSGTPGQAGQAQSAAPSDARTQARAAIAKGADRAAVIQRLKSHGIDPGGL
jgi:hypothetical protein